MEKTMLQTIPEQGIADTIIGAITDTVTDTTTDVTNESNDNRINTRTYPVKGRSGKPDPLAENFPLFGLGSLLYGLFFCFCLYKNASGITSPLICAATLAYYLLSMRALKIEKQKADVFFIACILLLGLSNMLTLSPAILFLNYCGIILLLFIFLIRHFYRTEKWDFTKYLESFFITACCSISHILDPLLGLKKYLEKHKKAKTSVLAGVLIGLVVAVPLLFVTGALLLDADAVFKSLADRFLLSFLKQMDLGTLFLILFYICFGLCASFGLLAEMAGGRVRGEMKDKRTLDPVIAITFTSLLTVVYFIFSVIQILYLFIGNMTLPSGYTYAKYAREGFFQLLFVCLINLALVLICMNRFKESRALKLILTMICMCTMIMIASSCLRMLLYIDSYGLTFLRIFVLLALLVITLCLFGVIVSIYKPAFPLFSYMLVCVSVCYILFSLAKPDYWIALYNVHYHAGDKYNATSYFYDLSADAAPVLVRAGLFDDFAPDECELIGSWTREKYLNYASEYTPPKGAKQNRSMMAYRYLNRVMGRYETLNIRNFNVSAYLAGRAFLKR